MNNDGGDKILITKQFIQHSYHFHIRRPSTKAYRCPNTAQGEENRVGERGSQALNLLLPCRFELARLAQG